MRYNNRKVIHSLFSDFGVEGLGGESRCLFARTEGTVTSVVAPRLLIAPPIPSENVQSVHQIHAHRSAHPKILTTKRRRGVVLECSRSF